MKGGKGGRGRQKSTGKPEPKPAARDNVREGPKRGAPKRDWGATEREEPQKTPSEKTR